MKDLFDELKRDGAAAIDRLIAEKREEGLQLEFKTKAKNGQPGIEQSDKANLSKELSAFANSAGGILIWGVTTVPAADGMPCAGPASLVHDVEAFKIAVDRILADAVMPRLSVELHTIASGQGDGEGFLAILVHRSDRRPHRAEFGNNAYYKRIGHRSMPMEHYDIEDAFRRLTVAQLKVDVTVRDGGSATIGDFEHHSTLVDITLRNTSSVSARYPYLKFESRPPGAIDYVGGADNVIHPGDEHRVCTISLTTNRPPSANDTAAWVDRMLVDVASTTISCRYGCMNARMRWAGVRVFGNRQLERLAVPQDAT